MNRSFGLLLGLIACSSLAACSSTDKNGTSPPASNSPDSGGNTVTPGDAVTAPAMTWTWVPVDGTQCRDGSATGFGINMNPNSKNLMIFLEGGGACYNALTCTNQDSTGFQKFDPASLATMAQGGVLDRNDASPVKDWSFVYIPYCTGDIHGGSAHDVTVDGETAPQQFVGYDNVKLDLAKIVATFPHPDHVLNTGVSAGGFGSAVTGDLVAHSFPKGTELTLIDDSGPPMNSTVLPKCLQDGWRDLWGFEDTFLKDCGADCPDHDNYTIDYSLHLVKEFPDNKGGLIESTDDSVITLFFGFGANDCANGVTPVSGDAFKAGLLDFRTQITAKTNNFGTYYVGDTTQSVAGKPDNTKHTWLHDATFYTKTVNGTKLIDWFTGVLNGTATPQVGP